MDDWMSVISFWSSLSRARTSARMVAGTDLLASTCCQGISSADDSPVNPSKKSAIVFMVPPCGLIDDITTYFTSFVNPAPIDTISLVRGQEYGILYADCNPCNPI